MANFILRHRKKFYISMLRFFRCVYRAGIDAIQHDGVEHSGYLAFLGMLCFFPFLVFLVALTGFLGTLEAGGQFVKIFLNSVPLDVAQALRPRIDEIISGPPQSLLTIAILGTIWTASSAVEGLRTVLNRAYRVQTPPAYILRRLMSIGQFLLITLTVIISMFLIILAPLLLGKFGHFLDYASSKPAWTYIRYASSSVILFLAVASLYFVLPNIKQSWSLVAPGAIVVVILWSISAIVFSTFLEHYKQLNVVYGSLVGIILALLFFYVNAFIFIYGAELNYLLEKTMGRKFTIKERVKTAISKRLG